ncbi:MAG: DUF1638 domain-containing protein [Gemmatimonadetes bacterium]|nr:DUF1638 domain-containing protein [Gemmatimonadota bacterium]
MTHYVALTCSALARSVYAVAATAPPAITVRLVDQGLHRDPENLRRLLQAEIDSIGPDQADAVLLAFGVCGNSTIGLTARHTPLVLPRVHDCIALYLGSLQRYQEEFNRHPGTYWYSLDYMERKTADGGLGSGLTTDIDEVYASYVEKYGKDNADYLMEVMGEWSSRYTRAAFIETGTGHGQEYERMAQEQARRRGWLFERVDANRRLLEKLLSGDWSEEEILTVPAGHAVKQSHDGWLVRAQPAEA